MAEKPNLPADTDGDGVPENSHGEPGLLRGRPPERSSPDSDPDVLLPGPTADARSWLECGWAILGASGAVTKMSDDLGTWLEQPVSDLLGRSFWQLLAARCGKWGEITARLQSGNEPFEEVKLLHPADASHGPEWFSLEITRTGNASSVRLSSILPPLSDLEEGAWDESLRTLSAQRQLFVRLLRAEAQLKTLTDRWPGVIFSQRSDLSFRFVSAKVEEITGVTVSDWQARPQLFWDVVHEGDVEELRQQFKQARQAAQPVTCTYRIRNAQTGRIAYVLEHRQANVSRGGLLLGYEGVWLDVTRQTLAEKRLSSVAWKETLSILTMGLAHDFSNVMAGIHALSETFLDQEGAARELSDGLTLIRKNAQHASQLVHRIINLHQGKTGERNYYNLNELATEIADLIRKVIPRRMQFTTELTSEPLPVYLDSVELRQVVLNLVLNAVDAMPQAGRLVLRTAGFSELPPMTQRQGVLPRLPAACLSIQDTGCGIKPRHLASIFDPFFTTKPVNKGSGLGLYNARLFAEKHRGAITVDSTEDVGSTFHIWLPQADFTEAETEARENGSADLTGNKNHKSY